MTSRVVTCTQFGLPGTSTQSKKKKKKKKKKNRYHRYPNPDSPYKKKRSRYRSKEEHDTSKAHRKSTRFTKNRSKRDLADIKCYKCGKFGHIAPNCKLQKLKALELDDGLCDKVYNLLYTSGLDSDYTYSETESEAEIDLIDLSESSKDLDNTCAACKGMMQVVTAHKWYIKCIILIDNSFSLTDVAMIDSGANMAVDVCADHPSAFWNRKRHIVTLPYEENFSEDDIPTKSRPCQMNAELVEFCKNEIDNLLQK
uniref:CCHC-type domain-containing protein n=1 Tax=Nicotiana tabacum TaxID=4097 RepID=A0A1S4AK65_TOBAC